MSETLYLQDNFLSDADWDLHMTEKDSAFHSYYSLSEESDDKPSQATNEFYPTGISSSTDSLIEELFQSFLPQDSPLSQNADELYFPAQRRSSTNTSSSAYSSDSSASPSSQTQAFDQFQSFSPDQFSVDLNTFISKVPTDDEMEIQVPDVVLQKTEICNEKHSKKSNFPFTRTRAMNGHRSNYKYGEKREVESDLERAVRLACEETNRLLSMHKHPSETKFQTEPASKLQPKVDLLKDLCDKTILNNYNCNSSADNLRKVQGHTTQLKRKVSSSQRLKTPAKKSNVQCETTLPVSPSSSCNSNVIMQVKSRVPTTETYTVVAPQTLDIGKSNRKTAPDNTKINPPKTYAVSTNSLLTNGLAIPQQPIQLCLKQDLPSPVVITNNTNASLIPVSHAGITVVKPEQSFRQNGQIVIQSPASTQPSSNCINLVDLTQTQDQQFLVPREKFVMSQSNVQTSPAKNLIRIPVVKPERNLLPLSDEAKLKLINGLKDIKPAVSNETQAKAAIAPAADFMSADIVSAISSKSAAVVMNGFSNQLQVDVKALKRHQRMIKNRASACQSRLRRKEYLKTLETQVQECAEENLLLRKCNKELSLRVKELETENKKLHCLQMDTQRNKKKAVCVLMLMLFIGINFFPFNGLDINLPVSQLGTEQAFSRSNNVGVANELETIRSGRHLLSTVDDETLKTEEEDQVLNEENHSKSLMVQERYRNELNKQNFWMDDLVQEYKNKHLKNFLKILSETPSNSVKRMLRRKLKEELGIQIPLPIARNRRIAYSSLSKPRPQKVGAEHLPLSKEPLRPKNTERASGKPAATSEQYLPLKPSVKVPTSMTHPCEQTSLDAQQPNETETNRVSNDLKEWAKRYSTDRQIKTQKRDNEGKDIVQNKIISNRAPVSRYMEKEKSNAIALYNRPIDKYDDFFQSINRRNDTFYVVSLNRDHLLLPATFMNSSAKMKMSLLMPAMIKDHAAKASFEDGYETMIQIECEVFNTRMFNLKRNVVPEFLLPKTHFYDDGKPVLVKNESEIWNQNNTNSMNRKVSRKKILEQESVEFTMETSNLNVSLLHRIGKEENKAKESVASLEEDAVVSDELESDLYQNKGR